MKHSLRHFAKHIFLTSRIYVERKKAKEDVSKHISRMRKSIIRMSLSYSEIDALKVKIEALIGLERKYAKFFSPEDNETLELKKEIKTLEQELSNEIMEKQKLIEEKQMMSAENDEKVRQLSESLDSIKNQTKILLIDKAKRQQRLTALDRKIREKIDVHGYYVS